LKILSTVHPKPIRVCGRWSNWWYWPNRWRSH